MNRLISPALLVATALAAGCASRDVPPPAVTVDREYSKPAFEVFTAALRSAESAGYRVLSDRHDQHGGEVVASRGDGREVRIHVLILGERSSRVSVRVEPGSLEIADMMHERIAACLATGAAASAGWWFGGDALDATYNTDMASCMTSARRTIATLTQNPTNEEVHATWSQIDGRQEDSTPVRIRMEVLEDGKTRVWFIVGTVKRSDNKAFAKRMKEEFETTTRPPGGNR